MIVDIKLVIENNCCLCLELFTDTDLLHERDCWSNSDMRMSLSSKGKTNNEDGKRREREIELYLCENGPMWHETV